MYDDKKITSYSLSPEAKGKVEYVSNEIADYIKYNCSYCEDPFYLVDPITHKAGGAIQRELIKHKDTGEVCAVKRTVVICLKCAFEMLRSSIQKKVSIFFHFLPFFSCYDCFLLDHTRRQSFFHM
jgi:hypothetical protein